MDNIVSLDQERDKREGPDQDCRTRDQLGQEMFLYILEYRFNNNDWTIEIWAYDKDDAEARITAIRETLIYSGQAYSIIPV